MDLAGLNVRLSGLWMDLPEDSPLRDWTALESDDCIDNPETAAIYRRARTGINVYRTEAEDTHAGEGWACGPREIEMAACGLWFARDTRPESDELFPMLPAFTSPAEASDQIRWALAHPAERAEAAAKARAAVADRTFTEHARTLLRLLDRQPVKMLGRHAGCPVPAATAGTRRSTCPSPPARVATPLPFTASWSINQVTDKQEVTAFGDDNKTYRRRAPGQLRGLQRVPGRGHVSQTYIAAADGLPRNDVSVLGRRQ